jgi:hypothetical protein
MTILALIFCRDPALLAERQRWLAARLQRQSDLKITQFSMADGAVVLSQRADSGLHETLQFGEDFIGRFGWSQQCLNAANGNAKDCFDSHRQSMPAMSALWCWQAVAGQVVLAADPLGARPLFYAQKKDCVTVTSALWLLESCPWIETSLDEAALHQRLALGYCLGGATPYQRIRRVQGGTDVVLDMDAKTPPKLRRWHRWDAVRTCDQSLDAQLANIHRCFMRAIADQDDGATAPVAALSGGLDTRVVIAGLQASARAPACLTFTWRNSLDGAIAQEFAKAAGLVQRVIEVPRPLDAPFLIKSGQALRAQQVRLWTGYGGSVGAGNVQNVARLLLRAKGASVSRFLFGAARTAQLTAQLEEAVVSALEAQTPDDAGRQVQLYLLENQEPEQLRALTENADSLGFDVAAPFYDPRLLELWLAVPLDLAMYHKAYVQGLQNLPSVVTAVPWQAYPGHVTSPLPLPAQLDQWSDSDALYHRQQSANDLAFVEKCAANGIETAAGISRWRQVGVRAAVGFGRHRQSYLLRIAAIHAAFEQRKGAAMLDLV